MEPSVIVVRSESRDGMTVVKLAGEIDVFASPDVKGALVSLIKEGMTRLVIDFEKVSYIDSTGLAVLVAALKSAREKGGWIAVVCTNAQIRRIFEITGLVKVFNVFDDVESARKQLVDAAGDG